MTGSDEQVHQVHWGYRGHEGPEFWGSLCAEFSLCGLGQQQSPIDIHDALPSFSEDVRFDYCPTALEIVNNGHTVQVRCGGACALHLAGKCYHLLQFHFHAPSEHTLNGRFFAMEAHLVHRADDGELLVVGVWVQEGRHHRPLADIWTHLPPIEGPACRHDQVLFNAADLLPATRRFYRYSGSLTTPPCSEGVRWLVCTEPVQFSAEQIALFEAIISGNNRPTQPLNDRQVLVDS